MFRILVKGNYVLSQVTKETKTIKVSILEKIIWKAFETRVGIIIQRLLSYEVHS